MKIAVCTPYYSNVTADYALSLTEMVNWTVRDANIVVNGERTVPYIKVFMRHGSLLPRLRNELAREALSWGADFLLWIDSDHSFPEKSLFRLLSLNLEVVGVNQPMRTFPTGPTTKSLDGALVWTTEDMAREGLVQEVSSTGLAFCLVRSSTMQKLDMPFFATRFWGDGIDQGLGEDAFFFNKIREAGIPVHVDHALSWEVKHAYSTMLSNADTVAQRELFESGGR